MTKGRTACGLSLEAVVIHTIRPSEWGSLPKMTIACFRRMEETVTPWKAFPCY